jgi:uncharacterized protein with ATP-grasp and redox domains
MEMTFNVDCLLCHMKKHLSEACTLGDDQTNMAFARELMELYSRMPEGACAPWLAPHTAQLMNRYYGVELDRYALEKKQSNTFVLERKDQIRQKVASAPDRVFAALQFAILGNYIDYSALHGEVSFEKLEEMLVSALDMELDKECYVNFCADLAKGGKLLYITDNAGEIVFDQILAEEITRQYPQVEITFCLRGGPANNDATREDAQQIGLPFPVIDNGNLVPGTQLDQLGQEARQALGNANIILAKGQGNAETMMGCGLNVYYAFLIKCPRFMRRFQKEKLSPMFAKERT